MKITGYQTPPNCSACAHLLNCSSMYVADGGIFIPLRRARRRYARSCAIIIAGASSSVYWASFSSIDIVVSLQSNWHKPAVPPAATYWRFCGCIILKSAQACLSEMYGNLECGRLVGVGRLAVCDSSRFTQSEFRVRSSFGDKTRGCSSSPIYRTFGNKLLR